MYARVGGATPRGLLAPPAYAVTPASAGPSREEVWAIFNDGGAAGGASLSRIESKELMRQLAEAEAQVRAARACRAAAARRNADTALGLPSLCVCRCLRAPVARRAALSARRAAHRAHRS